jgi:hypothetical protein
MYVNTTLNIKLSQLKFLTKLEKVIKNKYNKVEAGLLEPEIASIGAKNEYGGLYPVTDEWRKRGLAKGINLPEMWGIPKRPFMHDSFTNNYRNWLICLRENLKTNKLSIDKALKITGELMVLNIKETILNHNYRPNAKVTIIIKESSHPLIDTGKMYDSVKSKLS